jgi:hypothetical protein
MTGASAVTNAFRKSASAEMFVHTRTPVRITGPLMRAAQSLFPSKTAPEIAAIAHVSVRAVEHWMSGDREISTDALARLLRSEHGLQFLVALMGEARPRWWTWFLRIGVVSRVLRRRQADMKLLREAIDADRDITAAISRADALLVQDEEFHRPFADALGAMAGLQNRALAPEAVGSKRK